MTPETAVVNLCKLSEEKHQLVKQLLTLTEKQQSVLADTIDEKGLHLLNQIIEEKQRLADHVDEIDSRFLEIFEDTKKQLGISRLDAIDYEPVPGFKLLQNKIAEILEMTKQIQVIDKVNTENAQLRMASIKQELQTIQFGKQINRAYGKKTENASIFFDKKR